MPQLEIPTFTIPQIVDTVYVAKYMEPTFLAKYGIIIGPGIAAAVAMLGWWAVAALTRRNQLKSFEEGILDKVRLEMDAPLNEYRNWLYRLLTLISNVYIPDGHECSIPEEMENPIHSQLQLIRKTLNSLQDDKGEKFFLKYRAYSNMFPNLKFAETAILNRHHEMRKHVKEFEVEYYKLITSIQGSLVKEKLSILLKLINEQGIFQMQFGQYLQYECLKVLKRVKIPKYTNTRFDHLSHTEKGEVYIVEVSLPPKAY